MEKICKLHGKTSYRYDGKCWRCKQCRIEAVNKRRRALKEKLVEALGGSCSKCGYNKCLWVLEFHHSDPSEKEWNISNYSKSYNSLLKEAQKCILLCANCHREIEFAK